MDLQNGVKDPGTEGHATPDLTTMYLVWSKLMKILRGVVCPEYQDYMGESHPGEQRDDAERHHPVLGEEPLRSNVPAADTDENDGERETSRPPAHQQGRIYLHPRLRHGRTRVEPRGEARVEVVHREGSRPGQDVSGS